MGPKIINASTKFLTILGAIFGPELAPTQDGPKAVFESLKVLKNGMCKKYCFTKGKPYFLSLGGSQAEHKMLKMALKRVKFRCYIINLL